MTNLESLLTEIVKRHPDECRLIEISEEDMKRGWDAWKASAKKMYPLLQQLKHDRAQAFSKAHTTIIG